MTNSERSNLITKLMELTDEGMKKLDEKVHYNQGARFCINYVINYIMKED